jgi:serine/threonine protein kinase
VWALGVVLFQLLTCRWPFEAQNMPELCLKVVTEPPQSIASLRPELAPGLVAVIERCLEKDPAGRYADAAALAQALEPFAPELAPRRSPSSASLAGPEERPALVPQSTLVSPRVSSQLTPAPSAWDSMSGRTGASSAAVSRSRSFLWFGALAAVLIVALALVFSRRGPSSAAASLSDIAAQASAPLPRADVPSVTATLAPTAVPVPTATPAPAEAPALALAPAEPSALAHAAVADAGAVKLATPLTHPAKPPPHPPGQPRPTKTDDDIPALR